MYAAENDRMKEERTKWRPTLPSWHGGPRIAYPPSPRLLSIPPIGNLAALRRCVGLSQHRLQQPNKLIESSEECTSFKR